VLLGAARALGTTRLLGNLLYRVSPRDSLAFGSALVVVMALASVVACILPASDRSRARFAGLTFARLRIFLTWCVVV
jgi:hypothetical protein